jgi:acyl carrier protein
MSEYGTKIKEFIMTEVSPELNLTQIGDDDLLIDSGIIDSLGVLRIMAFLDESFGIDLSDGEIKLQNFKSVRTIVDLIQKGGTA